uniref:MADF domain-containing protein n=1 Tax=Heterorhabditis bacteriophora TaxID=37862 RepID=A0A1I7WY46_HETBA
MTSKNKTYHYDSEDGLIEEIEKLTAPPGKLNKLKNSNNHNEKDTPVSQKSWKSINTQYCIVCRKINIVKYIFYKFIKFSLYFLTLILFQPLLRSPMMINNRFTVISVHTSTTWIDHKLLKSISITERRALWNKYARQELDEITITRRFFDKIKSDKLKRSGKALKRPYTKVRTAVKDLYRKRWDGGEDRVQFANNGERRAWINAMATMHSDITIGKLLSNCSASETANSLNNSAKKNDVKVEPEVIHDEANKGIDQKNNYETSSNIETSSELTDDQVSITGSSLCDAATLLSFAMGAAKCSRTDDNEIEELSSSVKVVPLEPQQVSVLPKVSEVQTEQIDGMISLQDSPYDKKNTEKIDEHDARKWRRVKLSIRRLGNLERHKFINTNLVVSKDCDKDALDLNHTDDMLSDCIRRMKECSDDRERRIFALAAERLILSSGLFFRKSRRNYPLIKEFELKCTILCSMINSLFEVFSSLRANDLCHVRLTDFVSPFCAQLARHHATIIFDKVSRRFDLEAVGCQRVEVDGILYGKETAPSKLHCKCTLENMHAIESGAVEEMNVMTPYFYDYFKKYPCTTKSLNEYKMRPEPVVSEADLLAQEHVRPEDVLRLPGITQDPQIISCVN